MTDGFDLLDVAAVINIFFAFYIAFVHTKNLIKCKNLYKRILYGLKILCGIVLFTLYVLAFIGATGHENGTVVDPLLMRLSVTLVLFTLSMDTMIEQTAGGTCN